MTRRVAIYARYSSDRQSEASAEDQARMCREFADRQGWTVIATFMDAAMSGARRDRPQLQAMLARAADFDVVLTESLDRLSRDQEDIANIHKRLRFAGVEINTLADGACDELHIGVKGTFAAMFLRDLGQKTRRGQIGRVAAGRIPGGLSYGYDKVIAIDTRGEPERGLRAINQAEAEIVRRIVREYLLDIPTRETARRLNAEGVVSPGGKLWRANTITGHRARRNGILNNELYAGRIVYNRQRFIRDPDSRKRVSRPNPPDEWVVHEVPELRIVPEEEWRAAQAKLSRGAARPLHQRRRPRRLFSGLMVCGDCGGPVNIICGDQWGCSNRRETGTCANKRLTLNDVIERRVLGALKDRLLDPSLVSEYVAAYHTAEKESLARHGESKGTLTRLHREADATVKRLVDAISAGVDVVEIRDALREASERRDEIAAELAELEAGRVVTLHPRLADVYRERIAKLSDALTGPSEGRAEAKQLLRGMVEKVIVIPMEGARGVELEVHGRLAQILRFAQTKIAPAEAGADYTVKVVAGARSRLHRALSIARV